MALLAMVAAALLVGGYLLADHASQAPSKVAGASAGAPIRVTITPGRGGALFEPGAVGLSLEEDEVATQDLNPDHGSLVAFMRRLGPSVLRLGGNSGDYSWWSADKNERTPSWATNIVTPQTLTTLDRLMRATGWRVILAVDLGHFNPTRAAEEASAAASILGPSLLGIEIGNEPNDYGTARVGLRGPNYNVSDYLKDLTAYSNAITAAVPGIKLYGPDLSSTVASSWTWLAAIAADTSVHFAEFTQHFYATSYNLPQGGCEGTSVPSAGLLLSEGTHEKEDAVLRATLGYAGAAGMPVRISETGPTASCDAGGGPQTSPVFASALWALDWTLRSVESGVVALNFHGYLGRCHPTSASPLCAPDSSAETQGHFVARPQFYGLFAAAQLEGGRFLPIQMEGQSGEDPPTAYATEQSDHVVTLAIVNPAEHGRTSFSVRIPGYPSAHIAHLYAPSLRATGDVTFGRSSFSAGGSLRSKWAKLRKAGESFRLKIPPSSAVIVRFRQ